MLVFSGRRVKRTFFGEKGSPGTRGCVAECHRTTASVTLSDSCHLVFFLQRHNIDPEVSHDGRDNSSETVCVVPGTTCSTINMYHTRAFTLVSGLRASEENLPSMRCLYTRWWRFHVFVILQ